MRCLVEASNSFRRASAASLAAAVSAFFYTAQ